MFVATGYIYFFFWNLINQMQELCVGQEGGLQLQV